jgi:hypothetical protein
MPHGRPANRGPGSTGRRRRAAGALPRPARRALLPGGRRRGARPRSIDALLQALRVQRRVPSPGPTRSTGWPTPAPTSSGTSCCTSSTTPPGLGLAFQRSGDARYVQRWATLTGRRLDAQHAGGFIAADVTGRRVQNWIYSLHLVLRRPRPRTRPAATPPSMRRLLESLHEQVEFLCANLTPKRNHRTLELYAIFLAGVAFPEMRGPRTGANSRWRRPWPTCRPTCCPTACTASCRPTTTTWRCATGCTCAAWPR